MPISMADTPADANKLIPKKLNKLISGDVCVSGLPKFIMVPQCQKIRRFFNHLFHQAFFVQYRPSVSYS